MQRGKRWCECQHTLPASCPLRTCFSHRYVVRSSSWLPLYQSSITSSYCSIKTSHWHTHTREASYFDKIQCASYWSGTCFLRSATSADVSFHSSKGMSITTFTPLFTRPWRVEKVSDMPCTYTSKSGTGEESAAKCSKWHNDGIPPFVLKSCLGQSQGIKEKDGALLLTWWEGEQ